MRTSVSATFRSLTGRDGPTGPNGDTIEGPTGNTGPAGKSIKGHTGPAGRIAYDTHARLRCLERAITQIEKDNRAIHDTLREMRISISDRKVN
jgi:hypothetical protein